MHTRKPALVFLEINDGLVSVATSMTRSTTAHIVFQQQKAEFLNYESEPKDALLSNKGHANPYTDNNYPGPFPNAEMLVLEIAGNKKIEKEILEYRYKSSSFEKVRPEEMDEDSKDCWSLNRTLHDKEMVEYEPITVSTTKKQVEERQSRLLIQKQDYVPIQGDGETDFENYKECIVFMCFSLFKRLEYYQSH